MGDALGFLAEVRELVAQLQPLHRQLRKTGLSQAFLTGKRVPKGTIDCWVQIEKMVEIAEVLTELFQIGERDFSADAWFASFGKLRAKFTA